MSDSGSGGLVEKVAQAIYKADCPNSTDDFRDQIWGSEADYNRNIYLRLAAAAVQVVQDQLAAMDEQLEAGDRRHQQELTDRAATTQRWRDRAEAAEAQLSKLEERIEYGHDVGGAIGWVIEPRGIKYARHQRTVHFYVDEPLLLNHWAADGIRRPITNAEIIAAHPADPDLMVSPEGDKKGLAELKETARNRRLGVGDE